MRTRLCHLLALACLTACCHPSLASQYDPHPPPDGSRAGAASWFEGWMIRLLPQPASRDGTEERPAAAAGDAAEQPASIMLIVGAMPHAPATWNGTLVSLAAQSASPAEASPAVYTLTNAQLHIAAGDSSPPTAPPSFASGPNFTVASRDGSLLLHMHGGGCQLSVRLPGAHLQAECAGLPLAWSSGGYGPEGCAAALPAALTGLHWFVHSLGTPMRWALVRGSQPPAAGMALAHMEKNWGLGFPSKWYWSQGLNATAAGSMGSSIGGRVEGGGGSDSSSSGSDTSSGGAPAVQAAFALAGGALPSPLAPHSWLPDAYLLGVRTAGRSWDMHPWDAVFTVQASPCVREASLLLTAMQPLTRRAVDVQIQAARNSFAAIDCPTREGFRPASEQSATASATVRLYEYRFGYHERGWVQKVLLEAYEFENVALEFGGEARCLQAAVA